MSVHLATFNVENLLARYEFTNNMKEVFQDQKLEDIVFRMDNLRFTLHKEKDVTAKLIQKINADVICLQEVENLEVLEYFNKKFLNDMYKYAISINSHDPRMIDTAVLSKFPIGNIRSNRHVETNRNNNTTYLFPRDCLEVEILIPINEKKHEYKDKKRKKRHDKNRAYTKGSKSPKSSPKVSPRQKSNTSSNEFNTESNQASITNSTLNSKTSKDSNNLNLVDQQNNIQIDLISNQVNNSESLNSNNINSNQTVNSSLNAIDSSKSESTSKQNIIPNIELDDYLEYVGMSPTKSRKGERTYHSLWLFCNHFTSMSKGRERSFIRRREQAIWVAKRIDQLYKKCNYKANFVVLGDLNDKNDEESAIAPLTKHYALENVIERYPKDEQWTHYYAKEHTYNQLDYLLIPKPLMSIQSPDLKPIIHREGIPRRAVKYDGDRIDTVGDNYPKASDHAAVSIHLKLF